jgi:hypothetical protein
MQVSLYDSAMIICQMTQLERQVNTDCWLQQSQGPPRPATKVNDDSFSFSS